MLREISILSMNLNFVKLKIIYMKLNFFIIFNLNKKIFFCIIKCLFIVWLFKKDDK